MVEIRITNVSDKINDKLVEKAEKMGVSRNQYIRMELSKIANDEYTKQITVQNQNKHTI
jgi:antitoxin component of RelBE/YafQ-DinJ toxin-antitoxin module